MPGHSALSLSNSAGSRSAYPIFTVFMDITGFSVTCVTIDWAQSDSLERLWIEADFIEAGLRLEGIGPVREAMNAALEQLNEILAGSVRQRQPFAEVDHFCPARQIEACEIAAHGIAHRVLHAGGQVHGLVHRLGELIRSHGSVGQLVEVFLPLRDQVAPGGGRIFRRGFRHHGSPIRRLLAD